MPNFHGLGQILLSLTLLQIRSNSIATGVEGASSLLISVKAKRAQHSPGGDTQRLRHTGRERCKWDFCRVVCTSIQLLRKQRLCEISWRSYFFKFCLEDETGGTMCALFVCSYHHSASHSLWLWPYLLLFRGMCLHNGLPPLLSWSERSRSNKLDYGKWKLLFISLASIQQMQTYKWEAIWKKTVLTFPHLYNFNLASMSKWFIIFSFWLSRFC